MIVRKGLSNHDKIVNEHNLNTSIYSAVAVSVSLNICVLLYRKIIYWSLLCTIVS